MIRAIQKQRGSQLRTRLSKQGIDDEKTSIIKKKKTKISHKLPTISLKQPFEMFDYIKMRRSKMIQC